MNGTMQKKEPTYYRAARYLMRCFQRSERKPSEEEMDALWLKICAEVDACQLRALFGFNALLHYETLDRQGNVLEENLQCETLQERFEELLLREKDARLHPAYAK